MMAACLFGLKVRVQWLQVTAFVLIWLIVSTAPRIARAGCGVPDQFTFAPPDKTDLPANPTLYVFVRQGPQYAPFNIDTLTVINEAGNNVAFKQAELPPQNQLRVFKLTISAVQTLITIQAQTGKLKATYRVASLPRTPPDEFSANLPSMGKVVEAEYIYRPGCGGSNGFLLYVEPQAPAYRIEVDDKTSVVPDQPYKGKTANNRGIILVGTIGCQDLTISTHQPLGMTITPLFADGTEGTSMVQHCKKVGSGGSCTTSTQTISYPGPTIRFGGRVLTDQ